jgi:hypothetical protein
MTPDDVRATAEQLLGFHEHFASLFGKEPAQLHAYESGWCPVAAGNDVRITADANLQQYPR